MTRPQKLKKKKKASVNVSVNEVIELLLNRAEFLENLVFSEVYSRVLQDFSRMFLL